MNQTLAKQLEQDKQRFEDWRATRKGKRTIPEELWKRVVPHVSELGLNRVSREFRVNYTKLKQKTQALGTILPKKPSRKNSPPSPFVPLSLAEIWGHGISPGSGPRLVLERADGRQLRLEGGWPEPPYLEVLIHCFYRS
jgi:hypothetical protein